MGLIPSLRKAKIICTLGPSSCDYDQISRLAKAGMNVARINFSHSTQEANGKLMQTVRQVARDLNMPLAVLQDLQGPKIRVGAFRDGPVILKPGADFTLTTRKVEGTIAIVSVSYPHFHLDVKMGDLVLLDDGNLSLKVLKVEGQDVYCRVVYGGKLSDHKGINLPDNLLTVDCLTPKDLDDLSFGLEQGVDYIALSFVQKPSDIEDLRRQIRARGHNVPIVAKIEKPQAVAAIEKIIELADVIMIARGDLGVEMLTEEVPYQQKRIIALCNQSGVPVITATQMLDSMISNPRPTRAEASDVANAILDGSDAVMLSGETASGKFPEEAVRTMSKIISLIEMKQVDHPVFRRKDKSKVFSPCVAIGYSACQAAEMVEASAIVCLTQTGTTAKTLARFRPVTPILALSNTNSTYNQIALYWGVSGLRIAELSGNIDEVIQDFNRDVLAEGLFSKGDRLVFTAGLPFSEKCSTNMLRIEIL